MPGADDATAALFARATALLARGALADAINQLRAVIRRAPGHAGARTNLAVALLRIGRSEEALDGFRAAAVLLPFESAAQANLGRLLGELGRHEEALECHRRAYALAPGRPGLALELAHALLLLDRTAEAIGAYRAALAATDGAATPLGAADQAVARNNLGNALRRENRPAEAVPELREALRLEPGSAAIAANLGKALLDTRAPAEAQAAFERALALDPGSADARSGLAVALLTQGRLPEGFAAFEHRWDTPQMRGAARPWAREQWRGEPANGRTLLVHAEQGQGDTLQFCRYAVLAARRGFRVVLEVQPSLLRLLRRLPGIARVVGRGEPLPPFDLHCPMLSLPLAFGTALDTIPAESFLHADPAAARRWKRRLRAGHPGDRLVGLVWAGNSYADTPDLHAVDRRRSIAPALLRPLLDAPGVRFVSLQKGPTPVLDDPRLFDPMGGIADWDDTAALAASLDLVIAVDTAVAHLAAGLGRPVWLLDRFDACWRWLDGREDSPWYPGLRVLRQPAPGEWGPVIGRVRDGLRTGVP